MSTEGGTKAVVAALLANTGIAVTKFIAFLLTGFSSMLAESIHSLADAGNQGLLLLGGKRSQREASEEHPFGYGRERYIYAFIVSIVLFSLGGLFALYEAYHKFHELQGGHGGDSLQSKWRLVPLGVLAVAIVLESLSFRTALIEGNKVRGEQGWWSFIRRAKAPELPVILLEDFAALVGLVVAFTAVGLSLITQNAYFDVGGTGFIGVLLIVVAVILAIEVKSLLIGESATRKSIAQMREAIESTPGVTQIIHMKTLHIAPEELLVAVKIGIDAGATGAEVAAVIDAAERNIRAAEPMAQQVFLEPDVFRSDHVPDARPEVPTAPSH
ncbi:cation diffusion facilitator family transporter [Aeromicrobium sp.]|uniref:cation diffusion facilitator family transporter n=1 Tax=Aeromicrobium sp. TaxID=1871063 RepID=UPI0019A91805|nr:cation diffusion facilitator family transporter [Aeromicrobium sp.]MBC7632025.1 cation diffusion facilitator family transporter [Aeromicrobium sp.]